MSSLKCTYTKCRGSLYCLDTVSHHGQEEQTKSVRVVAQHVIRYYACIECGRRYKGIEVLNPQHYRIKPIPKSHFAKIGITEEVKK